MEGMIQWNPGGASAESHAPHPRPLSEPPTLPLGTPRPAAWSVKCTLWPGRPASGMGIQASVSFNIKRRQERAGESEASGSPRPREGRILPVALPAISRTAASVDPLLRLS